MSVEVGDCHACMYAQAGRLEEPQRKGISSHSPLFPWDSLGCVSARKTREASQTRQVMFPHQRDGPKAAHPTGKACIKFYEGQVKDFRANKHRPRCNHNV
jgi:hypothetical protein